jgi:Rrf2 family nitric oxide-sensitive transcriptional repressor
MRLTVYTDHALRVLMYLSVKYGSGEVSTIDEIAEAYAISRNNLTKIVHELSRHGVIETVRGRAGGARLARDPRRISIGEVVRIAEKDFAVVECHAEGSEANCAISAACNLKRGLGRAMEAFMKELDRLTLADALTAPAAAAQLLGIAPLPPSPAKRTGIIPIAAASAAADKPKRGARRTPATERAAATKAKPATAATRTPRKGAAA